MSGTLNYEAAHYWIFPTLLLLAPRSSKIPLLQYFVCVLPFHERNRTSHPYKIAGKIVAILIFTLWEKIQESWVGGFYRVYYTEWKMELWRYWVCNLWIYIYLFNDVINLIVIKCSAKWPYLLLLEFSAVFTVLRQTGYLMTLSSWEVIWNWMRRSDDMLDWNEWGGVTRWLFLIRSLDLALGNYKGFC